MKIGIVTSYGAHNYGAMLQAWALMTVLSRKGHDVSFVDTVLGTRHVRPWWKTFAKFSKTRFKKDLRSRVEHSISSFASRFPTTPPLHTRRKLRREAESFDAIVVGSDQMWNPAWALPWLDVVFLDFAPPECRRIAYAPSFGTKAWGESKRLEAGRLLRKFSAVSVRETSGVDIVSELAPGVPVQVALDPTLLLDGSDYEALLEGKGESVPATEAEKPVLFSYFLPATPHDQAQRWTRTAAEILGDPVVRSDAGPVPRGFPANLCRKLGIHGKIPVESWLERIRGASFVVTNSFHGTVFSILFRKPFATVLLDGPRSRTGMNERAVSLLSQLGLESRMAAPRDFDALRAIVSREIDWSDVGKKLEKRRAESMAFLDSALAPEENRT